MELTEPAPHRPSTGWGIRILAVATGLALLLVAVGFARTVILDSQAQRELQAGNGIPGTFTLERHVRRNRGKPPASWAWEGTFVSDDGRIVRSITHGPVEADPTEPGSAGWEPGDQVPAQWVPETPNLAYAPDADGGGWWLELLVLLVIPAVGVVAFVIIRRRLRRTHPGGWTNPAVPPAPSPPPVPTEDEVNAARLQAGRAEQARLQAELKAIERDHDR